MCPHDLESPEQHVLRALDRADRTLAELEADTRLERAQVVQTLSALYQAGEVGVEGALWFRLVPVDEPSPAPEPPPAHEPPAPVAEPEPEPAPLPVAEPERVPASESPPPSDPVPAPAARTGKRRGRLPVREPVVAPTPLPEPPRRSGRWVGYDERPKPAEPTPPTDWSALDDDPPRPRTRGDCKDGPRPCPWVSCKYHLFLDVSPKTGEIKFSFPLLDPEELTETCALDLAGREDVTLEDVGNAMGVTRERIRQIEARALRRLARLNLSVRFGDLIEREHRRLPIFRPRPEQPEEEDFNFYAPPEEVDGEALDEETSEDEPLNDVA
jgi:hypothetical protein